MTKRNTGNYLAIVIDNDVFSCPKVNAVIENGYTDLSDDMSFDKANALSTTLKFRMIPNTIKI